MPIIWCGWMHYFCLVYHLNFKLILLTRGWTSSHSSDGGCVSKLELCWYSSKSVEVKRRIARWSGSNHGFISSQYIGTAANFIMDKLCYACSCLWVVIFICAPIRFLINMYCVFLHYVQVGCVNLVLPFICESPHCDHSRCTPKSTSRYGNKHLKQWECWIPYNYELDTHCHLFLPHSCWMQRSTHLCIHMESSRVLSSVKA